MIALIGNLDTSELMIVALVAILIFGKRLPQVAAQAGSQLVKLRRSLDQAWRETGMEKEIRNVQRDLDNVIPRDLSLGEMARLASAEMDKRVRANEEELAAERAREEPTAAPPLPPGAGPDATTEQDPISRENSPSDAWTREEARDAREEAASANPKQPPSPSWESSGEPPI